MKKKSSENIHEQFYLTKHLEENLSHSSEYLFTVLIAPEGYGKTTTVRYITDQESRFVCWLDFTDGREKTWVKLLDNLQIADGHGLTREKDFYVSKSGKIVFQRAFHQIGNMEGGVLVFDHYEKGRNRQTDRFMEILLDYLPDNWHVYLMDSGGMKSKAHEWSMTGKLQFLIIENLMFHLEDIYRYFCKCRVRASIDELMGIFELSKGAIGEISKVLKAHLNQESSFDTLTPRELEIATYAAAGLTNREIGHTLFISENTVKTTLKVVFEKLDIHTKRHLIALFHREAIPLTGGGRV